MVQRFIWDEEMVQWMNMIMHPKNGFNPSVCPPTRVQFLMSQVCPMENTLFGNNYTFLYYDIC
jgi:hypothetical protein